MKNRFYFTDLKTCFYFFWSSLQISKVALAPPGGPHLGNLIILILHYRFLFYRYYVYNWFHLDIFLIFILKDFHCPWFIYASNKNLNPSKGVNIWYHNSKDEIICLVVYEVMLNSYCSYGTNTSKSEEKSRTKYLTEH